MKPSKILLSSLSVVYLLCAPLLAATIEGKVTNTEGQPVAGASVSIIQLAQLAVLTGQEPTPQTLKTGPDGAFTLETNKDQQPGVATEIFQGIVARARIQAEGYALTDVMLRTGANLIKLHSPSQIQGTIVDDKGAPVSNALVRWRALQTPELQDSAAVSVMLSQGLPAPETHSAADGTFALPGSAVGTKSVVVLEDPRFQQHIFAAIPGGEKITLVAKPAAVVQGRLVTPTGEPIANAGIWVMQDQGDIRTGVRTAADGRFTVGGLPTTRIRLMPQVVNGEWVEDPRTLDDLKAGETQDIGDWKLTKGVQVTGQLIDQDTGKPATGLSVSAGTYTSRPITVDAEGRFRVPARAGAGRLMILMGDAPYINNFPTFNVPPDVTTFDIGQIKLQRGEFLMGTVTVEGAESAAGLQLFAMQEGGNNFKNAAIEKDGSFKLGPLLPGKVNLQVASSRAWQVIEPKSFTVAPVGQTQPKLVLKLKKQVVFQARGRIVDTKGTGVPNVRLKIRMDGGQNPGTIDQHIETDGAGRFTVDEILPDSTPSLMNIERDGYELHASGQATKGTGGWEFSDTVLIARDASLTGRVLETTGKPANGALVLDARAAAKVATPKTVANGDFSLSQLAPGEVTILAALGRDFARTPAKTGTPAAITLKAPGTLRQEQLDNLLLGFSNKRMRALLPYRDLLGDEKLLEMALRLDAVQAGGPLENAVAGENVGDVLANAARRDPAKAAAWSRQQLERFPQLKSRASVLLPIWQALAVHGDDATRAEIKLALKEKRVPLPGAERTQENAARWFALAALASLLNDYHVDEYMDMGLTLADFLGKKDRTRLAEDWGRELAPGGMKLFERLEDEWTPDIRLAALCGAAARLTYFYPESVPELQKQLTTLAADPAVAAQDQELTQAGQSWRTSPGRVSQARADIAGALAKKDPEAALAIVATVTETWRTNAAYRQIVDAAIAGGKTEVAAKAVRSAGDNLESGIKSYFAAQVRTWDIKLSDEIFAGIKSEAVQNIDQTYTAGLSGYAFYRAPYDPAQSRLILEGEWLRRKSLTGEDDQQMNSQYLPQIAAAMVALDPARALEMLNEAPEQWNSKDSPRAQMLAYLLSTSPTRDLIPVGIRGDD